VTASSFESLRDMKFVSTSGAQSPLGKARGDREPSRRVLTPA
jgi:hypothetical protein